MKATTEKQYTLVYAIYDNSGNIVRRIDAGLFHPMTHKEACTMKSKYSSHKNRYVEVVKINEVDSIIANT